MKVRDEKVKVKNEKVKVKVRNEKVKVKVRNEKVKVKGIQVSMRKYY